MNQISRNISIIIKAERSITRRRMSILRNQIGLTIFAGLIATMGLVMLNGAGFYALRAKLSPELAALTVALVNIGLACILLFFVSRMSADKELAPIEELRDLAVSDLETDVETVLEDVRDLGQNMRSIARDPLGSLLPSIIVPLLASLLNSVRNKSD